MNIQDYRIRFSAPRINFDVDVGNMGQDIDDYPAPNAQARYDHLRMVVLGLLSNQASSGEPSQYRDGSLWFDLNDETLKIRRNDEWVSISNAIKIDDNGENDDPNTLQKWYDLINQSINSIKNDICYNGVVRSVGVNAVPIPAKFRNHVDMNSRPFVYINGILLDTTSTTINSYNNPTSINILSQNIEPNSRFTVLIKSIPIDNFIEDLIIV